MIIQDARSREVGGGVKVIGGLMLRNGDQGMGKELLMFGL